MNPFGQINGYNGVSAGNTQNLKYGKTANNQFYHFGNDMKTNPNDFLGSEFGYLKDNLKKSIGGNNPIFDQLFGNAQRRIGASTDRNVQDIKEQGAQSGFRGAGGNLINESYRGENEALSGVSDSLAMQEMNYQQNAINQLLGLNQFEGQTKFGSMQSDRDYQLSKDEMAQRWEMFQQQMDANTESDTDFWDVISGIGGSLLGGFGGGFGGRIASNWFK